MLNKSISRVAWPLNVGERTRGDTMTLAAVMAVEAAVVVEARSGVLAAEGAAVELAHAVWRRWQPLTTDD